MTSKPTHRQPDPDDFGLADQAGRRTHAILREEREAKAAGASDRDLEVRRSVIGSGSATDTVETPGRLTLIEERLNGMSLNASAIAGALEDVANRVLGAQDQSPSTYDGDTDRPNGQIARIAEQMDHIDREHRRIGEALERLNHL